MRGSGVNARPGVGEPTGEPLGDADPRHLGRYTVLGRLGEGGMGTVYLGRAQDGRRVALKVIRSEFAQEPEFRNLFAREAETARRVARFCTAEVLDVSIDTPQPFIATEYVPGPTLEQAIRDYGPMSSADLERLAVSVAAALTAIHGAGLVHRDLKPSNVLLSPLGPRVIDFGIARALDATTLLSRTRAGSGPGTPAFMSPEQALGSAVGPAADVFAWGGVVTFAATGHRPFGDGNPMALLYRVVHSEPDLTGLSGTLSEVVPLALAKDPELRPGAHELFLRLLGTNPEAFSRSDATREVEAQARAPRSESARSPIIDTRPGTLAPAKVGVGRDEPPNPAPPKHNPAGPTISMTKPDQRADPRDQWDREATSLVAAPGRDTLDRPPLPGPLRPPRDPGAPDPADRPASVRRDRTRRPRWLIPAAAAAVTVAVIGTVVGVTVAGSGHHDHPPTVARALVSARVAGVARRNVTTDATLGRQLSLAAYRVSPTPPARAALLASYGATLLGRVTGHTDTVWNGSLTPDGRVLATVSNDKSTKLWDVSNPQRPVQLTTLTHPDSVYWSAISPNGQVLADGGKDEITRLYDIGDPAHPTLLSSLSPLGSVYAIAFSPDGHTLAVGTSRNTVELWNVSVPRTPTHLISLTRQTGNIESVAFSPDGKLLAAANADRTVVLYDVDVPAQALYVSTVKGHLDTVYAAAFSPDSRTLATASADKTVRLWDVSVPSTPRQIASLPGHTKVVTGVAFSPDGRLLASTGDDAVVQIWDTDNVRAPSLLTTVRDTTGWLDSVAFSADGTMFVTTGEPETADLRDIDGGRIADRACGTAANRIDEATWKQYLPELPYTPVCP